MAEPSWEQTKALADAGPPKTGVPTWDNTFDPEEKYGGVSGGLKSFGLGVARSTSFGLSDEFLTHAGLMKPEDIKGYRETNPVSSTTGEIGGILGAVLAPEAGALGALSAPVKAVSKLGGTAARAIGEVAPASGTVGKILSQAGAHAVGSGVEGAFYGLGQAVTEDALGDPDALGEKLLSHVGTGALVGGALGSLIGAGTEAIPAALEKAGIKTESLRQAGENALIKTTSLVSGKSEADLEPLMRDLFTREGAEVRKSAIEGFKEREQSAQKFADNLAEVNGAMKEARQTYYQGERPEEISKLMSQVPLEPTFNSAVDLAGKLKSVTKAMREEPEIYSATGRIKKLENVSEGLERRLTDAKNSKEIYHAINDAKGQIQSLTKWDGPPVSSEADTVNTIKSIGREFRTQLENSAIYGEAGSRQAALNSAYSDFASAEKNMLQSFGRKLKSGEVKIDPVKINSYFNQIGRPGAEIRQEIFEDYVNSAKAFRDQMAESHANSVSKVDTNKLTDLFNKTQEHAAGAESELEAVNQYKRLKTFGEESHVGEALGAGAIAHTLGVPGSIVSAAEAGYAVYSGLKHPAELIRILSNIERAALKVTNAIEKGASGIFKAHEIISPIQTYGAVKFASKEERQSNHDKLRDNIADLTASAENFIDKLHEKTLPMAKIAPKAGAGVQSAIIRATSFLQQKLPGNDVPQKPLSPKYEPSNAELAKWHKYFSAIENPTHVLKDVATGTIVPETIEALSVVYPKLLSEMRSAVMSKMTEAVAKKKPIPYRTKLSLSLFLGSDLVNSLEPQSMLANQNTMATATATNKASQSGQMIDVNNKSLGKIKKSNRLLTAAQTSSQRQEA